MPGFGASLKKARESADLSLERIAAETRISTRFLQAIESEEFHLLPGGIFNRGFIRTYAERIGLDPQKAVAEYEQLSTSVEEPLDLIRNVERASARKTERPLYVIAVAALAVLIGAYYLFTRNASNAPAPASTQLTAAEPAQPTTPAVSPPAPEAAVPEPDIVAAATGPSETPATAAPAPAPVALKLDLDVHARTWIKATADGAVVFSGILESGATRQFTGQSRIDVSLGNAGGASLKVNGRDIGLLGKSGQVREFRFTPENAAEIRP